MTQMTAVSLFAGIGGFDLALERNGVKVVASVEIDKHAQGVLRKQFPNSQILGDIQEVSGEQLISAGFTPQHGVIVGGFPCQDLSVAGKRAGLAGARSGLFWEICRLLDETKARYSSLKMSLVCSHQVEEGIWESSSGRWLKGGIASRGVCLMLNTSESPKDGAECSLSDVLETSGEHLQKYSISPKAAQGILRRAGRRGKTLPQQLQTALEQVAGLETSSSTSSQTEK